VADASHEAEVNRKEGKGRDTPGEIAAAFSPYLFIILVFALAQWGPIKDWLTNAGTEWQWPGLDVVNAKGKPPTSLTYKFGWPNAAGTLLLVAGLLTMLTLRFNPMRALRVMGRTLYELRWATLTVATVLALAYVMNLSGQTITLGQWIAGASGLLPFLSGIIGWLGVAVTGSDTSSNSLFGTLQVAAAQKAGYSPTLLAAANSSGGVLGKMISPQNLAIGAAAVGMGGQEGVLFRKVVGWSILLVLIMCVIVYLQSTGILDWMVIGQK
jgi:lactate permease